MVRLNDNLMAFPPEALTPEALDPIRRQVHGIEFDDEDVCAKIRRGMRFLIRQQLNSDEDDPESCERLIAGVFDAVKLAIQEGRILSDAELVGFTREAIQRRIAWAREESSAAGAANVSATITADENRSRILERRQRLRGLPSQEQEIVTRFYLGAQSKEQICEELRVGSDEVDAAKQKARDAVAGSGASPSRRPVFADRTTRASRPRKAG